MTTTPPYPSGLPGLEFVRMARTAGGADEELHVFDGGELRRRLAGGQVAHDGIYDRQGRLHRVGAPSYFAYDDGKMIRSVFHLEGEVHRVGGPALTTYFTGSGAPLGDTYMRRGVTSRLDGPAVIMHSGVGLPGHEEWWVRGAQVGRGAESVAEVLRLLESEEERRAEIADSVFGPLLDEGVSTEKIVSGIGSGVLTVEGMCAFAIDGAPAEWARAFESGVSW